MGKEAPICSMCGEPMAIEKTARREISSLAYGKIKVTERVMVCPAGCRSPSGVLYREHSSELAMIAAQGTNYCYDVEVFTGIHRYLHHRQRKEIKKMLADIAGLDISDGEISTLEARFLSHFEALHITKSKELKDTMRTDGGYPLHIDATCEDGRGTTLVIYAGWRGWALGAWKIPSEREEAITPHIKETEATFGPPLSYISDLGKGMLQATAAAASTQKPGAEPLVFVCHTHFIKAVGKDALGKEHDVLAAQLRSLGIKTRLGNIAKQIGHKLCGSVATARIDIAEWANSGGVPALPKGQLGIAIARMICQWVLDFTADCGGLRFPFALPSLCLYHRCKTASHAIDNIRSHAVFDYDVARWLERIQTALRSTLDDTTARKAAKALEQKARIFGAFRSALKLDSYKPDKISAPTHIASTEEIEMLALIKKTIVVFCSKLNARCINKKGTKPELSVMRTINKYLDKYGEYLWGHVILTDSGKALLVDRTNNALESFYGMYKHGERRRSGRKCLTHDLESAPPASMLVSNLNKSDYVDIVCGGTLDNLPHLFANIDRKHKFDKLNFEKDNSILMSLDLGNQIVSTSLPLADKRLVRSVSISNLLLSASSVNTLVAVR